MDKTNIPNSTIGSLSELCKRVEETAAMKISTPAQFEELATLVFNRTGELLSPTTLKRIWGYLREPVTPRISTLDILARYCGWQNYNDFLVGNIPDLESGSVGSKVIYIDKDIVRGGRLRLMWAPNRVCVVEYLGNKRWKVVYSENTRLTAGDTFCCAMIASGEPLYINDVEMNGIRSGVYVCGRRTGVKFMFENT